MTVANWPRGRIADENANKEAARISGASTVINCLRPSGKASRNLTCSQVLALDCTCENPTNHSSDHQEPCLQVGSGFGVLAIIPRGGSWSLWGQVTLHVMCPLMPFRWQRALWNRLMLAMDRRTKTPRLTLAGRCLQANRMASDCHDGYASIGHFHSNPPSHPKHFRRHGEQTAAERAHSAAPRILQTG